MGAVPQFGFISSGGYWYPPNNSQMFLYTITKWSFKKNGLTAPTLLANIFEMELSKTIFVRLSLKILCGDFGEYLIIFGSL